MNRMLRIKSKTWLKTWGYMWALLLLIGVNPAHAQQLVCNDAIQVSLDDNCFFQLNLDMLLEAPPTDTTCLIIRVTDKSGNVVPKYAFNASHRDETFDYSVIDTCTGNSCWGVVLVEDKLPPQFDCEPFDTVWCSVTDYELPDDVVVEACGTYRRVITNDVQENFPCDSACAGMRWITYHYEDESGNKSQECVKEVCFRRARLSDITIPSDTIFDCMDFVDAEPSRTGVPEVDGYPIYPDAFFCEVNCDYEDQIIDVCPGTRKILRKWTCYDWCMPTGPENPSITWQSIKILDEDGPEVYCPGTDDYVDTIGTNPWACTGNTVLPEPHILSPGDTIIDSLGVYILSECSDVSYSVLHLAAISPEDCTPDDMSPPSGDHVRYNRTTGRWEAFDLPLGCNWFYYTFTDECGNSSECTFDIYVEDDVPPIAVCDAYTVVTINQVGTARVNAITFDDNSIDNCAIDSMDVRRMDSTCASGTTAFGPYVDFCCEDIGASVMVEFRVFDKAGNSNTCMVEVTVNDKEAPQLFPPPNITVDCRYVYDLDDLDKFFGKVVIDESWRKPIIVKDDNYAPDFFAGLDGWATDNCEEVVIGESKVVDLICGVGTIRRTFTATDPQGLKASGVQVITFEDRDTFNFNDIKWPQDVTLTGCVGIDTDSTKTGSPTYLNTGCAHLASTHKDLVYDQVPDACYKIERKWTVVDWCAFDLGYDVWQWDYTQIIKVTDVEDPYFMNCKDTVFCDVAAYKQNGQCVGSVDMSPEVGDKCTPDAFLELQYRIDEFDTGVYGPWVSGRRVVGDYPVGIHRIEWEVEDGCGNSSRCDYTFEVKDCKAPTPYCRNGIITVLMEGAGTITVWASDLDIGSFDNCTDTSKLIFSFDPNGKELERTYTCDSMFGQLSIRKTVRMYVTDECGNTDFCETIIELQDNNRCVGSIVRLSGKVLNEERAPLEDIVVDVMDELTGQVAYSTTTDRDGAYSVNVASGKGYEVVPRYNEEHQRGISTKDLTIIQRDLLGLKDIDSPYKVIAADANRNEDIGASDISDVRKVLLGRIGEFPRNTSWRFVQAEYAMPNVREPWDAPEGYELNFVDSEVQDLNFIGVKIGDLDNSSGFNHNSTRSELEYVMEYEVEELERGLYRIDFYGDVEQGMSSMQTTFDFDEKMNLIEIVSGAMNVGNEHVNDVHIGEGLLALAWNGQEDIMTEETLFSFIVEMDGLWTAELTNEMIESVGYDTDLASMNLQLKKRTEVAGNFSLAQNVPNPFGQSTVIGFELPKDQDFTLSFYATSGQMLKIIQGYGSKGLNEVTINKGDFPSNSGTVIFYQLDTETQSATRKLVVIE